MKLKLIGFLIIVAVATSVFLWTRRDTKTPQPKFVQFYKGIALTASKLKLPNLENIEMEDIKLEDLPIDIKNLISHDVYNLNIYRPKYQLKKNSFFIIKGDKPLKELSDDSRNTKVELKRLGWNFLAGSRNEQVALIEAKNSSWQVQIILIKGDLNNSLEIYALAER